MPELLAYLKINGMGNMMGNMRNGRNGYENELNTDLLRYTTRTFSAIGVADNFAFGGYLINGNIDLTLGKTIIGVIPLSCASKITSRRKGIFEAMLTSDGTINYSASVSTGDTYEMVVGIIYIA